MLGVLQPTADHERSMELKEYKIAQKKIGDHEFAEQTEEEEEPIVQQLKAEVNGLQLKAQAYNKQQSALRAKAKTNTDKREGILSKITQADFELTKHAQENAKLLSKVVQSPQKIQGPRREEINSQKKKKEEEKKSACTRLKNSDKMAMQHVQEKTATLDIYNKARAVAMMRTIVVASGVMALAALLVAAAAAAPAPAPALKLERMLPLAGQRVEDLSKLDMARLSRNQQAQFVLGSLPGLYYARVKLGNPPKEFSLQFDTGSDLLWTSCSPCENCQAPTFLNITLEVYNPESSSTSSNISCSDERCTQVVETGKAICDPSKNQCGYTQSYVDGSITSGYYVSDTMHLDTIGNKSTNNSSASVIFGCSNSRTSQLPADGVIGFGKNVLSVFSQLSAQGVSPKVFSHCLKGSDDGGGGILVLAEVVEPGFVFTPLVPSMSHYNVNMSSISVNGQKLAIDSSLFTTTIMDSGTTLAYLADGVYDPVITAIMHAVSPSVTYFLRDGIPYFFTSNRSLFPTVTLHFEDDAALTVGPNSYLLVESGGGIHDSNILYLGFQRSNGIGSYKRTTILGDLVLRDKMFVFNLETMTVGWVNYNCSRLQFHTATSPVVSGSLDRRLPYNILITIGVAIIALATTTS